MDKQAPDRHRLSLLSTLADASKLSDFIADYAGLCQIPHDICHDLRLVAEEAFVNIASYAYPGGKTGSITVELSCTANGISITFTDHGIAFDPLAVATDKSEACDYSEGGMGIQLIRSLTDHQKYTRDGQSNVFTVTKHYTKLNNKHL